MPHTSHRHKTPRNKRTQVVDDDGWTRVSSSNPNASHPSVPDSLKQNLDEPLPTSVDPRSINEVLGTYKRIEAKWLASQSCRELSKILRDMVLQEGCKLTRCICFGTGSFGDVVENGWINRSEVAIFQIAAFKSVTQVIEEIQGSAIESYAQEPRYNELDHALLMHLNISRADTPKGFDLVNEFSLVHVPGGEPFVLAKALDKMPAVYMGSRLDWYATARNAEYPIFSTYAADKKRTKITDLEAANAPFHEVNVYWRDEHTASNPTTD